MLQYSIEMKGLCIIARNNGRLYLLQQILNRTFSMPLYQSNSIFRWFHHFLHHAVTLSQSGRLLDKQFYELCVEKE